MADNDPQGYLERPFKAAIAIARGGLYIMFHWQTRLFINRDVVHIKDDRYPDGVFRASIIRSVGVVAGSKREGNLRVIKQYFGPIPHQFAEDGTDIFCPVCGYYCLGHGGYGCIDKPSMVTTKESHLRIVK